MAYCPIRYSPTVSDYRLPSYADIMRMPAGDREPRLRALIQQHRSALAAIDPEAKDRAFRYRRTGHVGALLSLDELVRVLGMELT
jgi:hypothetical protein